MGIREYKGYNRRHFRFIYKSNKNYFLFTWTKKHKDTW